MPSDAVSLRVRPCRQADGEQSLHSYLPQLLSGAHQHRHAAAKQRHWLPAEDLKKIFASFASFGTRQHLEELDGPKFSKLCRDCKLLGRLLSPTDIDLIFASAKQKGVRKVH